MTKTEPTKCPHTSQVAGLGEEVGICLDCEAEVTMDDAGIAPDQTEKPKDCPRPDNEPDGDHFWGPMNSEGRQWCNFCQREKPKEEPFQYGSADGRKWGLCSKIAKLRGGKETRIYFFVELGRLNVAEANGGRPEANIPSGYRIRETKTYLPVLEPVENPKPAESDKPQSTEGDKLGRLIAEFKKYCEVAGIDRSIDNFDAWRIKPNEMPTQAWPRPSDKPLSGEKQDMGFCHDHGPFPMTHGCCLECIPDDVLEAYWTGRQVQAKRAQPSKPSSAEKQFHQLPIKQQEELIGKATEASMKEQAKLLAKPSKPSRDSRWCDKCGHDHVWERLYDHTPMSQPSTAEGGELTDEQAHLRLAELREWAKVKWGDKPIDPTGPEVGSEITQIPFDKTEVWQNGETQFTYTEEMAQVDYERSPWRYIPRWLYELREVVGQDE